MPDKLVKFLRSPEAPLREKLKNRLEALKQSPFAGQDIKKLKGSLSHQYRLRVGKIRIIYEVKDGEVSIIDIDFRGNID